MLKIHNFSDFKIAHTNFFSYLPTFLLQRTRRREKLQGSTVDWDRSTHQQERRCGRHRPLTPAKQFHRQLSDCGPNFGAVRSTQLQRTDDRVRRSKQSQYWTCVSKLLEPFGHRFATSFSGYSKVCTRGDLYARWLYPGFSQKLAPLCLSLCQCGDRQQWGGAFLSVLTFRLCQVSTASSPHFIEAIMKPATPVASTSAHSGRSNAIDQ